MAFIKRRGTDSSDDGQQDFFEESDVHSEEEQSVQSASENEKTLTAEESEEKAAPKPRRKRVVKAKAVSEIGSDESVQAASSEAAASETESSAETSAETSSSETNAAPEQTEFGTQYQSRPRYDGSQSRRWNNNRYVSNRRYNNRGGNYERNLQSRLEAVQAAQRIENPEEYESKPRLLINDLTKMSIHRAEFQEHRLQK